MDEPQFETPQDLLRVLGQHQEQLWTIAAACQAASRWLTYNAHALHDPDEDAQRGDGTEAMPAFLPFYIAELEGVAKDVRDVSMRLGVLAQPDRPRSIGQGFAPILRRLKLRA